MNAPENNLNDWKPLGVEQEVMRPTHPPSQADLLLMAKLFALGDKGTWVRSVDAPTSDPAKRVLHSWVRKGYVYYKLDVDTNTWLLILADDCARLCGEAITAAFEVRTARSMLDKKPAEATKPPVDPVLKWTAVALLLVISVELTVEFFK